MPDAVACLRPAGGIDLRLHPGFLDEAAQRVGLADLQVETDRSMNLLHASSRADKHTSGGFGTGT